MSDANIHPLFSDANHPFIIGRGRGLGEGEVTGRARFVASLADLDRLASGQIVMAERVAPEWQAGLAEVAALVVNEGALPEAVASALQARGALAVIGATDAASPRWSQALVTVRCGGGVGGVFEQPGPVPGA